MAQRLLESSVVESGIGTAVEFELVIFVPTSDLLELIADLLLDDEGCRPDGRSIFDPEPSQLDFEREEVDVFRPSALRSMSDRLSTSAWPV